MLSGHRICWNEFAWQAMHLHDAMGRGIHGRASRPGQSVWDALNRGLQLTSAATCSGDGSRSALTNTRPVKPRQRMRLPLPLTAQHVLSSCSDHGPVRSCSSHRSLLHIAPSLMELMNVRLLITITMSSWWRLHQITLHAPCTLLTAQHMQIHYMGKRPDQDESGVRLSLTRQPQPLAAGMVHFASWFSIPPHQPSHHIDNRCCYNGFEPAEGFAFRVHTHMLGR